MSSYSQTVVVYQSVREVVKPELMTKAITKFPVVISWFLGQNIFMLRFSSNTSVFGIERLFLHNFVLQTGTKCKSILTVTMAMYVAVCFNGMVQS